MTRIDHVISFIAIVIAIVFGFVCGYMAAKERVRDDCLAIQKIKAGPYFFTCEVIK
jgi:ABC-type dipeptide/oligopeptide/nickel transport system permease subunit